MKRNIRLLIEYDGANYRGWQKQGKSSGADTIQGRLEQVLSKMTGEEIQLIGSGRTDAGVHALGQVANFHTDCSHSCDEMKQYLIAHLPSDIGVLKVSEAGERFHSRLNAAEKTYRYRIAVPGTSHAFERTYLWYFPEPLNLPKMRQAASYLIGTHDFKGFSSIKKTKKSTIREIHAIDIKQKNGEIQITFTGNGFLHNMVRIITGTLAEIGCGKKKPEDIFTVLRSKNRQDAGMTAPPQGLFLVSVRY
ncbi:MAG TPA: tRNA pseudouridine(38-40) synthase TruA [Candidatus Anaerostipes excrementavium]|uniref:tRNA pseudouridine synthase A n=1 Tax=Candidatus Anaerostipes excrementavium TaxID=2838463 RepID=A0A9D2BB02_9FIRM|nr:tRNA pseudouridine(38-40) synthase TruA [uncultured Anaerostipes sp.]HIX68759.1 tRNA pseudouridine(38-40) synthase TruA [Candidatus Anaerostipes excrementavium]